MSRVPLPTTAWVVVVGGTFVSTVIAFVFGSLVQAVNVPFGLLFTSVCVFAAAGVFFPLALNLHPARFAGLDRVRPAHVAVAALCALVNVPFANFLMAFFTDVLPEAWSEPARQVMRLLVQAEPTTRVVLVLAAAVAAPLGEELFFRGWLQTALSLKVRRWISVLVVAVLFSTVHGDAVGFVPRIELGLLFGVARAWTGSLWPAIAMHAVHNGTSVAGLYLADDPWAEIERPFDLAELAPFAAGSALLVVLLLVWLKKLSPDEDEETRSVAPLVGHPPFVPALRPALTFLMLATALALVSAGAVWGLRDRLPGHELEGPKLPSFTPPTSDG